MQFTKEQETIIQYALSKEGILLVPAGAGCGKTFLSLKIVEAMNPRRGLYTAFNKAIVEDSIEKFRNTHMECRTLHSLARKYAEPMDIRELSYNDIKENISYPDKAMLLEHINEFSVSDSKDGSTGPTHLQRSCGD